ncbi:MAG TPA: class II aldolase/adducin family protein [Dehalococcoidia bacterium]|nr:class II aldolase/adducin family protein [Dehalococcoidia bacterium]
MTDDYARERQEVLDAVRRIVDLGLVGGASGNVSRRIAGPDGDLMAITASRVPYHRFSVADVLVVDFDIEPVAGEGVPSSESLLHAAIYRARPDAGAVIHTHSVHASAFAVAGAPVPAVLDEQAVTLGGAVEVAAYAASATEELARNAVAALGERAAVLLRHHGVAGVGRDLEDAVAVVELVERVARIAILARALGPVPGLPEDALRAEQQAYRMLHGLRG